MTEEEFDAWIQEQVDSGAIIDMSDKVRKIITPPPPAMNDDRPKIIGVNRRYYPAPDHRREICTITVLVLGDIGDYAAYTAHGDDPEFAARFGDKIKFEEACCHFPGGLERERYRD